MPKTTFILITVLFGVICGNRLMDNRLLRTVSPSSYAVPYKSLNSNSFNGKTQENRMLKTLQNTINPIDMPCDSGWDFEHDLTARHCNDNLLKNTANYLTSDNNDDDNSIHNLNDFQNVKELDDVFEVEPVISKQTSKNMKVLQPKLDIFPVSNYKDFYDDLVIETAKEATTKRNGNSITSALGLPPPRGCDCKIRNDLVDLGQQHFPRYLLNAVCHSEQAPNDLGPKCWSGSVCRPLEYKVKVLTLRTPMDNMQKDPTLAWLPDDLRQIWKFRTVTVSAGCFCS